MLLLEFSVWLAAADNTITTCTHSLTVLLCSINENTGRGPASHLLVANSKSQNPQRRLIVAKP